jgi:hypothetical protein
MVIGSTGSKFCQCLLQDGTVLNSMTTDMPTRLCAAKTLNCKWYLAGVVLHVGATD